MTTLAMPRVRRDSGMEGMVAKWYAANTAEMMNQYVELAERIAAQLPPGSSVLEVAPGPGYFSIELAKRGDYAITGLDLSQTFQKVATKNAAEAGVNVAFRQGSASEMPFPANRFDFLLCRAAFKNFGQPVAALEEMARAEAGRTRADYRSERQCFTQRAQQGSGKDAPHMVQRHHDQACLQNISA